MKTIILFNLSMIIYKLSGDSSQFSFSSLLISPLQPVPNVCCVLGECSARHTPYSGPSVPTVHGVTVRQTGSEIFKIICDTFSHLSIQKAWVLAIGRGWLCLSGVGEEVKTVRKEKPQSKD